MGKGCDEPVEEDRVPQQPRKKLRGMTVPAVLAAFPHGCDSLPEQLKEGLVFLAHSSRVPSILATKRKAASASGGRGRHVILGSLSPFYAACKPSRWSGVAHSEDGSSVTSPNLTFPHRHAQRLVSWAFLHPVQLMILTIIAALADN